jgi:hypothetical protein
VAEIHPGFTHRWRSPRTCKKHCEQKLLFNDYPASTPEKDIKLSNPNLKEFLQKHKKIWRTFTPAFLYCYSPALPRLSPQTYQQQTTRKRRNPL